MLEGEAENHARREGVYEVTDAQLACVSEESLDPLKSCF